MRKATWLALLGVAGTAVPARAQEGGGGRRLSVNDGLVIWTLVVFAMLLYVLKRSAWPVLLAAVREREQRLERLLARAREEYDQLLVRARKEIAEEKEKALLALRREAVDLTIAAASKLIEAQLDTEANRRLVTEYLEGLERAR